MKVLILTSRDYYSFYKSGHWDEIDCKSLSLFINEISQSISFLKEDPVKIFFSKESVSQKFWSEHESADLKLLRRAINNSDLIYVMPCIPSTFYEEGDDYLQLRERQNYLGIIIGMVLEDLQDDFNANDIYIVVHDMDISESEKERHVSINEIENTSILQKLINDNKIVYENIYGYKHKMEPRKSVVYPLITEKLSKDDLPMDILQQFCEKMENRRKMFNC